MKLYLLSDRGPNYMDASGRRILVEPGYAPRIGEFEFRNDSIHFIRDILLKTKDGLYFCGIPGRDLELAFDVHGDTLTGDRGNAIDSEDLVIDQSGHFWVTDEYYSSIKRFDQDGVEVDELSPMNGKLPLVFSKRFPNRGIESLTTTQDGATLIGMFQGPLNNTTLDTVHNVRMVRLFRIDMSNGSCEQFAYMLEDPATSVSAITALDKDHLLVLERDAGQLGNTITPALIKRVYLISLTHASDIGVGPSEFGTLYNGRTLEEISEHVFLANYRPVDKLKEPILDLVSKGYPHDKCEGLAFLEPDHLIVSNDDDFGIIDVRGMPSMKYFHADPVRLQRDENRIYLYKVHIPEFD